MKPPLKALLLVALAGGAFIALLRKGASKLLREHERMPAPHDVPTANPVRDAMPDVEEPLREPDLRVAQNSPL
jgi:hypothetical protein